MSIVSPQIEVFEPFTANTDSSRTNMSSKQLQQCIISKNTETPYIINKNFKVMTDINTPYCGIANEDGIVMFKHDTYLIFYYNESKTFDIAYLPQTKKMVNNSLTRKYVISEKKFKKGDVLWDYTNLIPENKLPRIGYRAKVMYSSFFGYNADDAIVISESFAERCTIDYSEKVFIPITSIFKYFKNPNMEKYLTEVNEITDNDFYLQYQILETDDNMLAELCNFQHKPSNIYAKNVLTIQGGTIASLKIHKLNPDNFEKIKTKYSIYNNGLIEEIENLYGKYENKRNYIEENLKNYIGDAAKPFTNLLISNYETVTKFSSTFMKNLVDDYKIPNYKIQTEDLDNEVNVDNLKANLEDIDVMEILDESIPQEGKEKKVKKQKKVRKTKKEEKRTVIDFILEIEIVKTNPTCVGDKFANLFAGKGVVSLIVPDELMPKGEDNDPADVIFNPLGLFGRNNWGTIFEIALGKIIEDIESSINNKKLTIKKLNFINEKLIKKMDTDYYNKIKDLIKSFNNENFIQFQNNVLTHGLYLFMENFPGISYQEIIDTVIKPYEQEFNINIVNEEKTTFSTELMEFLRKKNFHSSVFKDTEPIVQNVFFGYNYMLKLFHTSFSKYNSVGLSSSFSKQTGQPARGKKVQGGIHMSWQTLVSYLAHTKNNNVLKEMYSFKSDIAIKEKSHFITKMISNGHYHMKNKTKSTTKTTLNNTLKIMGAKFLTNLSNEQN